MASFGRPFYFMKHIFTLLVILLAASPAFGQELYVFSEPASNVPAHTITPKIKFMGAERLEKDFFQRYTPEVMFGLSNKFMFRISSTVSNMHTNGLEWESVNAYAKYRFLSKDKVHRHFRMAAFAETGYSNNPLYFDEISIKGDNSGFDFGLIATQLIYKTAISATAAFIQVFGEESEHLHQEPVRSALNYSLSAGYLVLPRIYESFEQLNFNIYMELLGQQSINRDAYFVDLAPAVQFIFNSNSKLNLGYRFQLAGNANRGMERSFLVSFEHSFFNALKKKK